MVKTTQFMQMIFELCTRVVTSQYKKDRGPQFFSFICVECYSTLSKSILDLALEGNMPQTELLAETMQTEQ